MNASLRDPDKISPVLIDSCDIVLGDFIAVARLGAEVQFSDAFCARVAASRTLVERFVAEGRAIYGVTTGFGDNVRFAIPPADAAALQRNIVRSHAVSVGEPLLTEAVRAVMLMMIVNMGQGHSGASPRLLEQLRVFLNRGITPRVPGDGSVAYLAVEAHIALALIGEGTVCCQGRCCAAADLLRELNIAPVELGCKEGLALLGGTTSATAQGLLALWDMQTALRTLPAVSALTMQALRATTRALDPRVHAVKKHPEQRRAAEILLRALEDSEISERCRDDRVQDATALRAAAQLHGAFARIVREAGEVILDEAHSCGDNPIIAPTESGDGEALSTGNFDGSYLASHADLLCIGAGMLANLIEADISRMLSGHLSGLPPFLAADPGLHSGLMVWQYTAAGLLSEMRALSAPMSVDNVPTCADQETPVSFDYHACRKACHCADKLLYLLAIELYTAVQAVDFLRPLKLSPATDAVYCHVRERVPFISADRYMADDVEWLKGEIQAGRVAQLLESAIGPVAYGRE